METIKKTLVMHTEQTTNPDGSITILGMALADDREIGTAQAAKMLGLHRETVCMLCEQGEEAGGLSAWKLPSVRGNAKWRIRLSSVLSLRDRNSPAG